jgi:hypothetical protein
LDPLLNVLTEAQRLGRELPVRRPALGKLFCREQRFPQVVEPEKDLGFRHASRSICEPNAFVGAIPVSGFCAEDPL